MNAFLTIENCPLLFNLATGDTARPFVLAHFRPTSRVKSCFNLVNRKDYTKRPATMIQSRCCLNLSFHIKNFSKTGRGWFHYIFVQKGISYLSIYLSSKKQYLFFPLAMSGLKRKLMTLDFFGTTSPNTVWSFCQSKSQRLGHPFEMETVFSAVPHQGDIIGCDALGVNHREIFSRISNGKLFVLF